MTQISVTAITNTEDFNVTAETTVVQVTVTLSPEEQAKVYAIQAAASAAAALASEQAAELAETNAELAEINAETAETNAETAATTATTQAGIATTQAGIATTQAGIATTQAGLASASQQSAALSAQSAYNSELAAAASALAAYNSQLAAAASAQLATQFGLNTVLTGFTVTSNSTVLATDTILQAFGKVQAQINNKQNTLGFTAENVANKAINLTSPDDIKYPTTLAVSTALAGKQNTLTNPITGTGVSGQVAFWSGTGSQTGDSGLTWDNVAKTIEIKDSLNTGLRISAAVLVSSTAFTEFRNIGQNRPIVFRVGGNNTFSIFTSGNSAFNTTTDSGFRLDVNGTARVQGNLTTNLTLGSVPFIGASGLLSQDNSNLFWDNTNKRLGVGTNAPAQSLHVIGNIRVSTTANNIFSNNFVALGNAALQIRANTTDPIILNGSSGGNVIIGTTTDAGFRLDVNGTARVTTSILVGAGSTTGTVQSGVNRSTFYNSYANNFTIFETNNSTGAAKFYNSISIGTPSDPVASAQLEIVSTTKGFLPPRMTSAQRDAIASPAAGLVVYNTTDNLLSFYNGTAWTNL